MRIATLMSNPELNVAIFTMPLNLPWEFWQVPFFRPTPSTAGHWGALQDCTRASLGDAALAIGAFWLVAVVEGSRAWILKPTRRNRVIFVLAGALATGFLEWHATQVAGR
jgi:hypothetical protein